MSISIVKTVSSVGVDSRSGVGSMDGRSSVRSVDSWSDVGGGRVGNADGRDYVLDYWADSSISVAFNRAVGKVAA